MSYHRNINGKLALGYGSKFQLLRMLGWHRDDFNMNISRCLKEDNTNIHWFDFNYNKALDNELLNLEFISDINEQWKKYWPCGNQGIHWDCVGKTINGTYLLVEAKANEKEIKSECKAKNETKLQIQKRMQEFIDKYNIQKNIRVWMKEYYQFANRLIITDFLLSHNIQVKLIYILFVNGYEYNCEKNRSMSIKEWEKQIDFILTDMGIKDTKANELINVCYIDCNKE